MKIRGVLLGTVEEQIAGGDRYAIDPANVRLPIENVPVSVGFQSDQRIGHTTKVWLEDGRILFEAEIDEDRIPHTKTEHPIPGTAAIGMSILENEVREGKQIITKANLFEVGLTDQNENRNQPPWKIAE